MNPKFLYTTLKQFPPGLRIILLVTLYTASVYGQSAVSPYNNDVSKQRLLIRITAHYLHTISQGQIDMGSAIRIPCKVYGLSPFLVYNEGFSNDKPSACTRLLDAGKVQQAKALLSGLNDETRLQQLLELGTYFLFKPGTDKADLERAAKYITEAVALSGSLSANWKIESLILQAHLLHQSGLKDESQKILAEAMKLCEQSGNSLALAKVLLNAGMLFPYGHPSRLSNLEKARSIFQKLNAKEKEIETLSEITIEHFVVKRYNLAELSTLEALELAKKISFRHLQYSYDALAFMDAEKGDVTSALSFSKKSLESLGSAEDSVFASFFFTRQALLYRYLVKFDEAIVFFDKALEKKSGGTRLYWYKAFLGKVQTLNIMGKPEKALALLQETGKQFPPTTIFEKMYYANSIGEAYERLQKFGPAEDNYKAFLTLAGDIPYEYVHGEFPAAYFNIFSFYVKIGKTARARELLDHVKQASFNFGPRAKGNYYSYLFIIDSTEKRYQEAIKDLQLSRLLLDSVLSFEQRKKADELLVKYETAKKEKNIESLNNQNQLQRISVEQANRTRNITLAGVVLLMIIIGLLFNRYIIKQKSNRELEANQKELDQKNGFLETMNAAQNKLLREKEWLLKEVHHRVKNNLQMVTSLLNSQSAYLDDDAAKLAVKDSLRRMQAMSLIHQKLYLSENISTIAMPEYINELVSYLHESFDTGNRIIFEQTIDPLNLDVLQAIPLGLIINESIVNAIKYAFINEQKGVVSINLQTDGAGYLLLKISDNGIGLPAGFNITVHNSLGLDLMQGLAKQLNGSFALENNNGVHIMIRFLTKTDKLYG